MGDNYNNYVNEMINPHGSANRALTNYTLSQGAKTVGNNIFPYSALAGGMSLVGSGIQGLINYGLTKKQWEREDTAVRRRMEDIEKAGLSKTLAVAGGGAASTAPTAHNNVVGDALDRLSTMIMAQKSKKDLEAMTLSNELLRENIQKQKIFNKYYDLSLGTDITYKQSRTRYTDVDTAYKKRKTLLDTVKTATSSLRDITGAVGDVMKARYTGKKSKLFR